MFYFNKKISMMSRIINLTFIIFLLSALSGCQSEDGNSKEPADGTSDVVSFAAQSVSMATGLQTLYKVDLSDSIYASDSGQVEVLGVDNLSGLEVCEPVEVTATGFSVSAKQYGVCDYRYYIGRPDTDTAQKSVASVSRSTTLSQTNSYGVARVAITSQTALTPLNLIPITYNTTVDSETEAIDIKAALAAVGVTIGNDYVLQSTVTMPFLPNDTGEVTQVDTTAGSITYKPKGGFKGVERLLFSYKDSSGAVKLGALDIAVAHNLDKGFEIKDKNNSSNPPGHITYGVISDKNIGTGSFTIDIKDHLVNLNTNSDCGNFHLVYLDVFNATVTPADSTNYTNNLQFNFTPSQVGSYYISFAVSNHCGAYQMGVMEVIVEELNQEWKNIALSWMQMFTAPRTPDELDEESISYTGTVSDTSYAAVSIDVAAFNGADAVAYCEAINGRLPTPDELKTLVNNPLGTPKELEDWPIQNRYLAKEGNYYYSVNLSSGGYTSTGASAQLQVSCVKEGFFDMEPVNTRCTTPGGTIQYRTTLLDHSNPLQEWVEVALSSTPISPGTKTSAKLVSNSSNSDSYFTASDGRFVFGMSNTMPDEERVEVTATYDGVTIGGIDDWASFGYARALATDGAYALLEPNGSVVAWGDRGSGGYPTITGGSSEMEADTNRILGALSSGVVKLFATNRAFAALKEDGSVVTWGASYRGGSMRQGTLKVSGYSPVHGLDITSKLSSGVVDIVGGARAFAALKEDGTVWTWGDGAEVSNDGFYAGNSSAVYDQLTDTSNPVEEVITNGEAFVAIKEDGQVVAWGPNSSGGSLSIGTGLNGANLTYPINIANALSSGVEKVFSASGYLTTGGFAAIKTDGSVVTWGGDRDPNSENVGNSKSVYYDLQPHTNTDGELVKVEHIYSTASAMAALRSDGSLVVWGMATQGGSLDNGTLNGNYPSNVASLLTSGVKAVYSNINGYAFVALKEDGTVVTWGNPSQGGDSSAVYNALQPHTNADGEQVRVKEVFSSKGAFAALRTDGTVVSWGDEYHGADNDAAALLTNVETIYTNRSAFVARKESGQFVAFGDDIYGGEFKVVSTGEDVSAQLGAGSKVREVMSHPLGNSFIAIKEDSRAVGWGSGGADLLAEDNSGIFGRVSFCK